MTFIYLATPHNHPDPQIRDQRFQAAQLAAVTVFAEQIPVYSPIAHWHPISITHDLPHGWNYWKQQDEAMLSCALEMWIILIDGWQTSKGIAAEQKLCRPLNKPIRWIDPEDLTKFCRHWKLTNAHHFF